MKTAMSRLNGASVLITGGTGSFGRAFVAHLRAHADPARLIVFSRDELKQSEMQGEIGQDPRMRYFIGDVRDADRLEMAFHGVDYVIHAAALKQVPAAEYNPFECVRTNIHGAENVVRAALRTGVKRVVALSTDKAVNPVNLYGASKLASDKIFVAANHLSAGRTAFSIVRYGNVVGSRGSVIPLFKRLLAGGARDLPVTDPRMTRFLITLEEGVRFVIQSLEQMHGGEIFVPKIPSASLDEIVRAMPGSVGVRNVGIRPGEKLHEVMVTEDDARHTLEFDDRYVILPEGDFPARAEYEKAGARPVSDRFRYASDGNPQRLDREALARLIATV